MKNFLDDVIEREIERDDATEKVRVAKERLNKYRQWVKEGEATIGDPVDNFAFVWHGDNREYWQDFYHALSEHCVERTPILVKFHGTQPQLFRSTYGGRHEYRSQMFSVEHIGVLTGPPVFDVKNGNVAFPVTPHYVISFKNWRRQTKKVEGAIIVVASSFNKYGAYVSYRRAEGDLSSGMYESSMNISFGKRVKLDEAMGITKETDLIHPVDLGQYDTERKRLVLINK